jgi:hypothetical protein
MIQAIKKPRSATLRIIRAINRFHEHVPRDHRNLLPSSPTLARDNGEWKDQPTLVRQWFETLMQIGSNGVVFCYVSP